MVYMDDQRKPSSSNLEATQVVSTEDSPFKVCLPDVESSITFKDVRRSSQPAKKRRLKWPAKRYTVTAAVTIVVLLLAFVGYVAVGGLRAKGHLQRAAGLVTAMQQQVQRGDAAGAKATLIRFQQEMRSARDTTNGTSWAIASHSPFL